MRSMLAAFAALTLTTPALAQNPAVPPKLADEARQLMQAGLNSDVGYQTIEDLTTEIGPRLGGSEDEARARDWAVDHLKSLGFKNVRVEEFDMPFWSRVKEEAEIVSPFPQPLIITALGNSVATPEGGITAEVVRFSTMTELENAPMDDSLKGKIVFVDETMVRTQDGSSYGVAVRKRSGAANEAAKRGAVAALIKSVGTDNDRMPHTGGMRYIEGGPKVPIAALSFPDAEQLGRALDRGPVTVKVDISVLTKDKVQSGNVIAEIPGKTDEIVLIGGHLDSWDLGTGAVDDGAGIGIVTGAGKAILDLKKKPQRTIRIVYFGSEEVGLIGAFAYARQHAAELGKHVMAAESDFGAGKIYKLQSGVGKTKVSSVDAMQKVMEPLGIARGDNMTRGGPDVTPLAAAGVPVAELAQNGWDYFDLHHTPNDTLDKVNPDDIAQNVAAYAAFTWMAANMPGDFRDPPSDAPSGQ